MHELSVKFQGTEIEKAPQVFRPWRRLFARTPDVSIYGFIWAVFLAFVLNVDIFFRRGFWFIVDALAAVIIMLFVEPLLLSKIGTTPGKAILGLCVRVDCGRKLTYDEGIWRTWHIIGKGYGYHIPIYALSVYLSYRRQ